jgi:hypothetical protein
VTGDVVLGERLLDQQQAERVELGEVVAIGLRVGAVGVDLEQQVVAEALADGGDGFDVPPGLDLQLDAEVAVVEVAADDVEQLGDGGRDADGHAAVDLGASGPEVLGQRPVGGPELGVEHGQLDRGLGHRVPVHPRDEAGHVGRGHVRGGQDGWRQVPPHDVVGAVDVLGRVARFGERHALAPALGVGADDVHEQGIALGLRAERGAERGHQRQAHAPQLDPFDLHGH